MLSHSQIWQAIDALAARHGLSPSGLARRAGLDPTAFNPSKRIGPAGRLRWPSTHSLAKILEATHTPFSHFAALATAPTRSLAVAPLSAVHQSACFDGRGRPTGPEWHREPLPCLSLQAPFGLRIDTDDLMPLYRPESLLIASRGIDMAPGDRVVMGLPAGTILIRMVLRINADGLVVRPLLPEHAAPREERVAAAWHARIVWASQ